MNKYPLNSTVQLRVKFRSRDNNGDPSSLSDPTAVVWKYSDPDGNVTSVTSPNSPSSKIATGIYQITFTVDQVGLWRYRVSGDSSAREGEFEVTDSLLA